MKVTVAIPTYNRCGELDRTLASLMAVEGADAGAWEVLVVDNASADDTVGVVGRWEKAFGGALRYVKETRQGLCYGRNRAASEASGDVVAYLDDDVDVDPGWLEALMGAYQSGDYAVVGGRAHLVYPTVRPTWVADNMEWMLSKVDHGDARRAALPNELYGVNLSIRKDWLERVGGFRTDLDRIGNCLLSGGETELLERIGRAGGRLVYEPGAVVGHRVAPERLDPEWFLRRNCWGIRSEIRMRQPSRSEALRRVCGLLPSLLRTGAGLWKRRATGGLNNPLTYQRHLWYSEVKAEWLEYCRTLFIGCKEAGLVRPAAEQRVHLEASRTA